MNPDTELFQHLFGQSLKEVSEEKLMEMIEKYPYFPHLHWWLAAKKKKLKHHKNEFLMAGVFAYHPLRLRQFIYSENETSLLQKPVLQPLYTEDYFAYTRTKLPDNPVNDKEPTMEKLKSFTGWLRTLKRPSGRGDMEQEGLPSPFVDDEKKVMEMEEESQLKEDVYTEAMAEIRVKIGQPEKAIAIYEKLILLNPEKKAYFAGKIDALKKQ